MDPTSVDVFYLFPSEEGFLNSKLFLDLMSSQFSTYNESFNQRIAEERYIARQTFHNTPDPLLNDESAEIIAKQRIERAGEFENLGLASAIRFDTNLQLIIDLVNNIDSMEIINGELFVQPKSQSISAAGPNIHQPSTIAQSSTSSSNSSNSSIMDISFLQNNSNNFKYEEFALFFFPIFKKYFNSPWFKEDYISIDLDNLNDNQIIFFYNTFMSFWFSSVAEKSSYLYDSFSDIAQLLDIIKSIPTCGIPQIVAQFIHRNRGVQHFWLTFVTNISSIQETKKTGCKKVKYTQPPSKTIKRKQRVFLKFKNDEKFRRKFYPSGFRHSSYFLKLDQIVTKQSFVRFLNLYRSNLKYMVETICNNHLYYKNNFVHCSNSIIIDGDYNFASNIRQQLISEIRKFRNCTLKHYYQYKLSNVGKNCYKLSMYIVFNTSYSSNIYNKINSYNKLVRLEDIVKNPSLYVI